MDSRVSHAISYFLGPGTLALPDRMGTRSPLMSALNPGGRNSDDNRPLHRLAGCGLDS